MKSHFLAVLLCAGLSAAPSHAQSNPKTPFLIDSSKHYAYLTFDHVGEREPLTAGEPRKGLWLRFVNNCRLPIVVATFDAGAANRGTGLFDEVVPNPTKYPIVRFEAQGKGQSKPAEQVASTEPPEGYSPPDFFSTTIIPPGKDLLFSVPFNHVGRSWSLQIRFYFELPGEAYGTGPYSVASFYWQDVPEKFREGAASPSSPSM